MILWQAHLRRPCCNCNLLYMTKLDGLSGSWSLPTSSSPSVGSLSPSLSETNTEFLSLIFITLRGNSDTRDQRMAFLRHVSLMSRNAYLISMHLTSSSWGLGLGVLVEFKLLRCVVQNLSEMRKLADGFIKKLLRNQGDPGCFDD